MTAPLRLFFIDCEVYADTRINSPLINYFIIVYQILHTARTVNNIYFAVPVAIMPAIVNHGTQRCKPDSACNKEQIAACKNVVHRKAVAVRPAYRNLLPRFHRMQPFCHAAAFFD